MTDTIIVTLCPGLDSTSRRSAEDGLDSRVTCGSPTMRYSAGLVSLVSPFGTHRAAVSRYSEQTEDGLGDRMLYTADATVLECFVFTVLGDDVRDDLDFPYLEFPSGPADVAPHYRLGEVANGSRTLLRRDVPVAAAPGNRASLSILVPLSHCLDYSLGELKQSFLHQSGAPLLRGGRYAPPPR